ncbi:hypothetical protein HOLleu_17135 [Holothuria leucospilota]|uniref:Uncharacterized protein n=1 Tax=Holothuria leucospilota TaxID=206669 RepID=A0A9Q1HB33_HOLLE|nr:hypothetical protein HOLleu_17135 [Holothuria leucospilota]
MDECSALIRDSFIERQLLDENDHDDPWQEDQILTENLLKSSHDVCSWIPKYVRQLRRNHNNKTVSQSKPQNKVGGSLRPSTQVQTKRSQGIPFRNVGKVIEFDFKHYHNPKKYIEQYRRFHTFGGPLEKLSSREVASYGHETDSHAKDHAADFMDENSNYMNLGHPFHNSNSNMPNGKVKNNPPDIELQLQLVSRRPATIQNNGRGNGSQVKYSRSFSGHTPLPNYCALTENAKSRRRAGGRDPRLRGHESDHFQQRTSSDAFLYATDVTYKAPHTAPTDISRRPLEVHLPHGEKMLLNNSKLYSWEQSCFTATTNGNYHQPMGQQLPRAPYMPGSLIRHLPPAYFSAATKEKSVDTKGDKSYR